MAHAPHSFRAINVFIQHTRYEIVFVLHWELVAMCSGAQEITGVLWFGEQPPQNMTRVSRDGPKEFLVCIAGQVSNGMSITREEVLFPLFEKNMLRKVYEKLFLFIRQNF